MLQESTLLWFDIPIHKDLLPWFNLVVNYQKGAGENRRQLWDIYSMLNEMQTIKVNAKFSIKAFTNV